VGLFLADRAATHKVSSLEMRLVAIRQAHRLAGHVLNTQHPAIRDVFAGIKRDKGTAQVAKAPATTDILKDTLSEAAGDTSRNVRDRAVLLLGFAAALRRSELVALDRADLAFDRDGLTVTLRRRKTDQEGAGTEIGVPYGSNPETCPVRAVEAWLALAGVADGPVFRRIYKGGNIAASRLSDRAVALIVKQLAERAGQDPALFSGHSLRAGLATSAAAAGVEERVIAKQTGHKSMPVLRRYIRAGSLFTENAAGRVGL
jgi:integrase